ncbi:hypothetical protein LCGC14_2294470 [marine sediment metagenome]|uniref:Uncharacterized protein n=1 Tax=marine sediment metagenome TaxID=412755 RepID=A0A0F9DCU9_9ZZZZ
MKRLIVLALITMFIGASTMVSVRAHDKGDQVTIVITATDGSFTDTLRGKDIFIYTSRCSVNIRQKVGNLGGSKIIKTYPADKVIAEEL